MFYLSSFLKNKPSIVDQTFSCLHLGPLISTLAFGATVDHVLVRSWDAKLSAPAEVKVPLFALPPVTVSLTLFLTRSTLNTPVHFM